MSDARIDALKNAIREHQIADHQQGFARDLVLNYENRGDLSDRQWYWVERLSSGSTPPPAQENLDLAPVIEFMDKAAMKLRFPKLIFDVGAEDCAFGEKQIRLTRAGVKSRYPGSVAVTSEGDFEDRRYFGRIESDGRFTQSRDCTRKVQKLLKRLADDFQGTVAAAGLATGSCVMCHKALTDDRSLEAGYGKTCAKNYGLVWGGKDYGAGS